MCFEFSRFAARDRKQRGERKPEAFTFLGFTHFCGQRNSNEAFIVWWITAKKRMVAKLNAIKAELQRRKHHRTAEVGAWLRKAVMDTTKPQDRSLRHQRPWAHTGFAGSWARYLRRCTWPLTTRDSGRPRDIGLSLRAERREALSRPFVSNPPENPAGPRDIQRLAPQALSPCVAPPACGFGGDHTRHLRDSGLPSNRRYIGAECHREPE